MFMVSYYRKHGVPGRLYARGPSAQKLSHTAKAFIFAADPDASQGADIQHFDVDENNAFPTMMWNEVQKEVGDVMDIDFVTFTAFVKHPGTFRSFLAEYQGITVKEAKKVFIKLLHFGLPESELPLLWALAAEFRTAAQVLISKDKYSYLQGMFGDRRNPMATRLHYALASVEDAIVNDLAREMENAFGEQVKVIVFMFDGLILQVKGVCVEAMQAVLAVVGEGWNVTFSLDRF